jgi:hypothetical protein
VNLVLISCNDFASIRMEYIFFTDLRSSKVMKLKSRFLRECRAKITKLKSRFPKGMQS